MLDPSIPVPAVGRSFPARRKIRLADMDEHGRLRLDAVARFLQDIAIDDVQETGWGVPDHLWFVRRIRVEVRSPFLDDREVRARHVVQRARGDRRGPTVVGRRATAAGRIEVDSVWIHLGPDQRPARIESFGVYAEATGEPVRLDAARAGRAAGSDVPRTPGRCARPTSTFTAT